MLDVRWAQGEGERARLRQTTFLVVGEPNVSCAPPDGAEVERRDQPAGPGVVWGAKPPEGVPSVK